jgi:hypothetical protein
LEYHDTLTGWTVNYEVGSGADIGYGDPTRCGQLQSFTAPDGRSGCYGDQAIRWNQLYTKFPHDGVIYVMNAIDPRPPSQTVATADHQWATTLVDSYQ